MSNWLDENKAGIGSPIELFVKGESTVITSNKFVIRGPASSSSIFILGVGGRYGHLSEGDRERVRVSECE